MIQKPKSAILKAVDDMVKRLYQAEKTDKIVEKEKVPRRKLRGIGIS